MLLGAKYGGNFLVVFHEPLTASWRPCCVVFAVRPKHSLEHSKTFRIVFTLDAYI